MTEDSLPSKKRLRDFITLLSQISATMASITFVGLSVILSIFESPLRAGSISWLGLFAGLISITLFVLVIVITLGQLEPTEEQLTAEEEIEEKVNEIYWFFVPALFLFLSMVFIIVLKL